MNDTAPVTRDSPTVPSSSVKKPPKAASILDLQVFPLHFAYILFQNKVAKVSGGEAVDNYWVAGL